MANIPRIVQTGAMTEGQYTALHVWVKKHLGAPRHCENCDSVNGSRYHWANISGEYRKELDDWARLCPRCHALFDSSYSYATATHCGKGHPMSGDNLVYYQGYRNCKRCLYDATIRYARAKKEASHA